MTSISLPVYLQFTCFLPTTFRITFAIATTSPPLCRQNPFYLGAKECGKLDENLCRWVSGGELVAAPLFGTWRSGFWLRISADLLSGGHLSNREREASLLPDLLADSSQQVNKQENGRIGSTAPCCQVKNAESAAVKLSGSACRLSGENLMANTYLCGAFRLGSGPDPWPVNIVWSQSKTGHQDPVCDANSQLMALPSHRSCWISRFSRRNASFVF